MKTKIDKSLLGRERERRKLQGYFDGRFRNKVVKDKRFKKPKHKKKSLDDE